MPTPPVPEIRYTSRQTLGFLATFIYQSEKPLKDAVDELTAMALEHEQEGEYAAYNRLMEVVYNLSGGLDAFANAEDAARYLLGEDRMKDRFKRENR